VSSNSKAGSKLFRMDSSPHLFSSSLREVFKNCALLGFYNVLLDAKARTRRKRQPTVTSTSKNGAPNFVSWICFDIKESTCPLHNSNNAAAPPSDEERKEKRKRIKAKTPMQVLQGKRKLRFMGWGARAGPAEPRYKAKGARLHVPRTLHPFSLLFCDPCSIYTLFVFCRLWRSSASPNIFSVVAASSSVVIVWPVSWAVGKGENKAC